MRILLAVSAGLLCAVACPLVEAHGLVLAQDPGTAASARPTEDIAAPATITDLTPGSRVRVWVLEPHPRRVVGEVLAVDDTTLRLRPLDGTEPTAVALSAIRELEVSVGRGTKASKGAERVAFIFGIAGGLAGLALGSGANLDCESNCSYSIPIVGTVVGFTLGGLVGAGLGAGLGPTEEWERWQRVPIAHPRAAPIPAHGPAMRVSWTFSF